MGEKKEGATEREEGKREAMEREEGKREEATEKGKARGSMEKLTWHSLSSSPVSCSASVGSCSATIFVVCFKCLLFLCSYRSIHSESSSV